MVELTGAEADAFLQSIINPQADHWKVVVFGCGCVPCQVRRMNLCEPLTQESLLRAMRMLEGGHA